MIRNKAPVDFGGMEPSPDAVTLGSEFRGEWELLEGGGPIEVAGRAAQHGSLWIAGRKEDGLGLTQSLRCRAAKRCDDVIDGPPRRRPWPVVLSPEGGLADDGINLEFLGSSDQRLDALGRDGVSRCGDVKIGASDLPDSVIP